MIGLLALTALPTTIAVAEGISSQKRAAEAARQPPDEKLMRKFNLRCFCDAKSARRGEVHRGWVVVGGGKVLITRPDIPTTPAHAPAPAPAHKLEGFYIVYPDDERPPPLPLGLVTTISDNPPMLNWLYIDKRTFSLCHGNRTQSRPHHVGPWSWILDQDASAGTGEDFPDENADGTGGGLAFNGEERFVVVEPESAEEGGMWEVRWDERDDLLKGVDGVVGRRVLRVSLDREFVEGRRKEEEESTKVMVEVKVEKGGEGKEGRT